MKPEWYDIIWILSLILVLIFSTLYVIIALVKQIKNDMGFSKPEPSDKKPPESFIVKLVTALEFIRNREGYQFSNKQLFLDYLNHITKGNRSDF